MGDFARFDLERFPIRTGPTERLDKHIMVVKDRRRLCDDAIFFLICCHVLDFFSDNTIANDPIGRFDKTELVDLCKCRKRCDESNIWTFWSFNGTDPSVVARMYVAHFEAGAFTV